jgi:hypothetical protein
MASAQRVWRSGCAQPWVESSVGMVGPFSKRAALKKGTAGKLLKQLLLLCKTPGNARLPGGFQAHDRRTPTV